MLKGSNILLGITGSIAAYKAVDIARRLMDEGADVTVVMTGAACRFIPPYTLETVTGGPVYTSLFDDPLSHIELAKTSKLFLIAPAAANTINKLSSGIADDLMSNIWLAWQGPVIMAPAMNSRMYLNKIVQKNIKALAKSGVQFAGPETGSLACGDEGTGRLIDVSEIIETAVSALSVKDLKGRKILVTAGPTREYIDPVRYISNRSSGKMGYAVAKAALRRGAEVTLISGPSSEKPPGGLSFIPVETASQMRSAVSGHLKKADAFIMTAAVSDFSPKRSVEVKLDKKDINRLELKQNIDILQEAGKEKGRRIHIGFAAETGSDLDRPIEKLKKKNLDLIVVNDIAQEGAGFDLGTNIVKIINSKGSVNEYPLMKKIEVADKILDELLKVRKVK